VKKRNREINIFSVSFLDVLANTIGGLAFLLIFAVMMIGAVVFAPPRILTERLPDAYHEHEYNVWLGAREGLGKFVWSFGEGERPPGLELDHETGKLAGVVKLGASDAGAREFVFVVNCASGAAESAESQKPDSRRFKLTVYRERPVNTTALRIVTESELPVAYRQLSYPLTFAAEGGQAPYRWTGNLPPGLTLSPDGQVTGQPASTGKFTFEASVSTPGGERQSKTFSLSVSENYPPPPPVPPLKVLTRDVPAAVVGRDYGVQMAAEGGSPPYKWTAVSGLPSWLEARTDATSFAGRPGVADVGQSRVIWQVSDSAGMSARTEAIELEVLPPVPDRPPPLRLKSQSLPDARVGQPYALAFAVDGGMPPYVWSGDVGRDEFGLSFSPAEGSFSGVPARAGEFPVNVNVADQAGQTAAVALRLRVRPPLVPLRILTKEAAPGRVGQPYSLAMSAVGGHPPYRWRSVGGQLPPGLSLDESTGTVSGVPSEAGSWEARVNVADAEEGTAAEPLSIRLEVLNASGVRRLFIKTRTLPALLAGRDAEVALACEGGTPPYSWRAEGELPQGLALVDGRLTGTPAAAGTYELKLRVTEASGQTAVAALPLVVKSVAPYWLAVLLSVLAAVALIVLFLLARAIRQRKAQPLRITTDSLPNARASFDYVVQLACDGGVPPYRWRVAEGELPPGMSLSEDGKLSGQPFKGVSLKDTIEVPFAVEVIDGAGKTARQNL
jgi:hypothetical protein